MTPPSRGRCPQGLATVAITRSRTEAREQARRWPHDPPQSTAPGVFPRFRRRAEHSVTRLAAQISDLPTVNRSMSRSKPRTFSSRRPASNARKAQRRADYPKASRGRSRPVSRMVDEGGLGPTRGDGANPLPLGTRLRWAVDQLGEAAPRTRAIEIASEASCRESSARHIDTQGSRLGKLLSLHRHGDAVDLI